MLKSIEQFLSFLVDLILPPREDSVIVKKLDARAFAKLPKAPKIQDFDWIFPLFHYKDNKVRALVWELKYKENTLPLEHLGKILYEEIIALLGDIRLFNADSQFLLIPIPISEERRMERGYNQSEHIAKAILENDIEHHLLYAPQWFVKVRETPRQSHSESREE